ncbi:tubulin-specific chaperone cofactor E-like protein isoform 3-T6 [Molossus nigricans]|uniref:tubulin-specific chaperone cofactor E-like protein isoform X3 n=1 Tax=Molossus molossus TaxID=27622 RepID=UPI0017475A5E|nr:tubulin-specific chaperone cofactor E-like protein isoform X3 [Molossus molossus]
MDQPSGRSFMQVLCEKYSPENFPYRRGPGMGVHVPATPQGSPMKDRLNLPSVLVLNSCGITCAGDETEIAAFCAHVSELDLSDNKLEDWHESLKLLHITDNNLQDWTEIRKLGAMFPSLDTLVLANNHLHAIEEPDDSLARLFPNLRSISLHKSGLQSWEDIDKLNSFPKLEEVRLLGIPLLQPYTTEERRKLVIARLPSVSKLNGSVVTEDEREDSERFFIRYHVQVPQEEVPCRYHELITKYGKLEPLAEVDLRPQSSAKVEVHFNDQVEEMSIRLDQTVAELKKQLKTLVQLPTSSMLLYHFDHEAPFGPEEMKHSSRAVHSFGIRDGDKIYVESKTK